jgi:hypothetical protein
MLLFFQKALSCFIAFMREKQPATTKNQSTGGYCTYIASKARASAIRTLAGMQSEKDRNEGSETPPRSSNTWETNKEQLWTPPQNYPRDRQCPGAPKKARIPPSGKGRPLSTSLAPRKLFD